MQEQAQLVIQRTSQRFGRRREFHIYVDGAWAVSLLDGGHHTIDVEPGHHEVRARADWYSSAPVVVDAERRAPVHLLCGSRIRGWRALFTLVFMLVPGMCIYLERIEDPPAARA